VPKLWNETIEAHRHAVREAILETTWALVTEHGLMSVTMTQIAEKAGIGRATLYKYFPDVEAILAAHHERHVTSHLEHLAELRTNPATPSSGSKRYSSTTRSSATTASGTAPKNSGRSCTEVSRSPTLSSSSSTCSEIC
jgi:AcrR family transcriptional regulator